VIQRINKGLTRRNQNLQVRQQLGALPKSNQKKGAQPWDLQAKKGA